MHPLCTKLCTQPFAGAGFSDILKCVDKEGNDVEMSLGHVSPQLDGVVPVIIGAVIVAAGVV